MKYSSWTAGPLKMKTLCSLRIWRTIHWTTQCHVPQVMNPQWCFCENLISLILQVLNHIPGEEWVLLLLLLTTNYMLSFWAKITSLYRFVRVFMFTSVILKYFYKLFGLNAVLRLVMFHKPKYRWILVVPLCGQECKFNM